MLEKIKSIFTTIFKRIKKWWKNTIELMSNIEIY